MKSIALIGAPVDLGAGRRGVDMGPSAIRYAGLRERLRNLDYQVRDLGNIPAPLAEQIEPPLPNEKLRYLKPLAAFFTELGNKVASVVSEGTFPIILGGDHSIALGSINGSALMNTATPRKLGVLWIDAHGDFNTADTTPSGNIHGMPLAALTGRGHPALTHLMGKSPVLSPDNVVLVGVRDLDREERRLMREARVHVFTMHDIDRRGMAEVMMDAIMLAGQDVDGIHTSFDMDVLDPNEVPGVGTPVPGGISYREAHLAMELIHASERLVSLDLVEVNPILDTNNHTAKIAVELICSAMGQEIF
ncbi:MAG: arginase [Anaerolineae bacterium]|nr:arginase [Anaerolineae bacterium]